MYGKSIMHKTVWKALDKELWLLFDKTGYEHLTSEEFKGIPNRKPKGNGVADYLKTVLNLWNP